MTRPVQLTIDAGGYFFCSFQEIYGEIIGEGRDEKGQEYIVFKDEDSERKIPRARIKQINTDVKHPNTT